MCSIREKVSLDRRISRVLRFRDSRRHIRGHAPGECDSTRAREIEIEREREREREREIERAIYRESSRARERDLEHAAETDRDEPIWRPTLFTGGT